MQGTRQSGNPTQRLFRDFSCPHMGPRGRSEGGVRSEYRLKMEDQSATEWSFAATVLALPPPKRHRPNNKVLRRVWAP